MRLAAYNHYDVSFGGRNRQESRAAVGALPPRRTGDEAVVDHGGAALRLRTGDAGDRSPVAGTAARAVVILPRHRTHGCGSPARTE
jgi:hypothetical protein